VIKLRIFSETHGSILIDDASDLATPSDLGGVSSELYYLLFLIYRSALCLIFLSFSSLSQSPEK
jgi:hypothetical protein